MAFSCMPPRLAVEPSRFGSSARNPTPSFLVRCVSPAENGTVLQLDATKQGGRQPRPAVILPGLGNNSSDYAQLVSALDARGIPATVAQVSRFDWLRNAAGLLDGNYWKGTLRPRPVLDWYLNRMKNAIAGAKAYGDKVSFIGHSAGGWLARVYMAEFGIDDVSVLITLGTPHLPPPKGVPGVFDQTRGLLNYVEETCPGAFHAPDVKYVCVASRYIRGAAGGNSPEMPNVAPTGIGTVKSDMLVETAALEAEASVQQTALEEPRASLRDRFIGQGYKQVCGQADVWGDGVVPEVSAHLSGATNITLESVYHSPVGASNDERPWYGSPGILEQWIHYLD